MAKTGDNSNLGRSSADVQFNRCSGLLGNGKVQDVVVSVKFHLLSLSDPKALSIVQVRTVLIVFLLTHIRLKMI